MPVVGGPSPGPSPPEVPYSGSVQVNHAADRQQFGKAISRFGVIQEKLAHMAMLLYVTEVSASGQPPPSGPPPRSWASPGLSASIKSPARWASGGCHGLPTSGWAKPRGAGPRCEAAQQCPAPCRPWPTC